MWSQFSPEVTVIPKNYIPQFSLITHHFSLLCPPPLLTPLMCSLLRLDFSHCRFIFKCVCWLRIHWQSSECKQWVLNYKYRSYTLQFKRCSAFLSLRCRVTTVIPVTFDILINLLLQFQTMHKAWASAVILSHFEANINHLNELYCLYVLFIFWVKKNHAFVKKWSVNIRVSWYRR